MVFYPDMQRKARKTGFAHVAKTILIMLFTGLVCAFIAAHLYSFAIRIGLSPSAARRLPNYAFFAGLALGLAVRMVRSVKDIVAALVAVPVTAGLLWFMGVVLEALLVAFGLDEDIASWISRIAFWVGMVLGMIKLYEFVRDRVDSLHERLKG